MRSEHKAVVVPLHRIIGIELIAVMHNKIGNTIGLECHRSVHRGVAGEAEQTAEPLVASALATAHHHILRHSPFVAPLYEGEVIDRPEILIESHLIVDIL